MKPVPMLGAAARLVVGAVLIWAGAAKITEPAIFAQTVRAYEVLPLPLVHPFAVTVPWVEVVAGVLLVAGLWTRSAGLVAFGLFGAFGVAIGVNLIRGADFSCGCFGVDGGGATLTEAAVRDALLLALAGFVLMREETPLSLDRLTAKMGDRQGGRPAGHGGGG